jgi:diaminopimelate decarboxylase
MATVTTAWAGYADELASLRATLAVEDARVTEGSRPFQPLSRPPAPHVLAAAREIDRTPAILWDLPGLHEQVNRLRRLVAAHGLGLNAAIKACRTPAVLALLAEAGLGADVASMDELGIARRAGFRRLSATGPGFRAADISALLDSGVLFDAQSATQLDQVLRRGYHSGVGLRLRVPLPDGLRSSTSRGSESRFGVMLTTHLVERLRTAGGRVTRLRVHSGEATARTLEFRTRYALLAAGLLGGVEQLNLGGGLLRLCREPGALDQAVALAAATVRAAGAPGTRCWVEPGAALVVDSAYLVTGVLDIDRDGPRPAVTVDASAWNIAPWTYPSFYPATGAPWRFGGTVFGPTLYEKDAFRRDPTTPASGPCPAVGDRLVGTSFGAYTLSNARSFAGLAPPRQYAVTSDTLEVIDD